MNKSYHIITFGCQMNERDSETLAGMLEEMGYSYIDEPKQADVVLFNTCSVRENADKKFFGVLGQLKHSHEDNPDMVVGLCGCMMQQERILKTLKQKYPWVDLIFGTHNLSEFPNLFKEVLKTKENIVDVWENGKAIAEGLPAKRTHNFMAYVNIMQGCNNFCSYCIVPYTRGRERSRRPEEILCEIKELAKNGCKEIMLLGQNVNSYGRATGVEGSYSTTNDEPHYDFAKLLREIDKIDGIERIRFMTSHPKDLSDDLIDCFRDLKHLCHQFHLPVQSGSSKVLKEMNRIYNKEDYLTLVKKLKSACPDIALSTDIIVGFPGESEEDFQETLDLVSQVEYDSAYTFIYSIREGTPAAEREDQVDEKIKHERFDRLVNLIHEIQTRNAAKDQDKIYKVLVEGPSKTNLAMLTGRNEYGKTVDFAGSINLVGQIVDVRITKAQTFSLYGELV